MRQIRHILFSVLIVTMIILVLPSASANNDDPFDGMLTYDEGQYKVGLDFIAGEYVLLSTSDYPGYFAINSDANGRDTIANGLFDVNSIITVYDGEYLELSRLLLAYRHAGHNDCIIMLFNTEGIEQMAEFGVYDNESKMDINSYIEAILSEAAISGYYKVEPIDLQKALNKLN